MTFVANAPAPAARVITNDGWWPDIDAENARQAMRLVDGTVTPERLAHELIAGIIEVGRDLADWKAVQQALGHARLADVPGARINGQPYAVQCYLRAVYCYAKAAVIERMQDYDLTGAGQRAREPLEETPDQLRRDALWAITALQGRSRATVELI